MEKAWVKHIQDSNIKIRVLNLNFFDLLVFKFFYHSSIWHIEFEIYNIMCLSISLWTYIWIDITGFEWTYNLYIIDYICFNGKMIEILLKINFVRNNLRRNSGSFFKKNRIQFEDLSETIFVLIIILNS